MLASKLLYIKLLLGAVAIAVVALYVYIINSPPRVRIVGGTHYNGGMVPLNKTLEHVFVLENPNPFRIGVKVSSKGCDCTTAVSSANSIGPYGSALITLKVKPDHVNQPLSGGVCIVTDHGKQSLDTWLILTGRVVKGK